MNIPELYDIFKKYPTVITDSRKCLPNSIFFALKGGNFDGNLYAKTAIAAGCEYAIVDNPEYEDESSNILLVDDCLKTLQDLAAYHRRQFKIPVIGITGSNGKTTSKELITAVLSEEYNVLSTEGNLNNHIGVPLTLLKINKSHEIAIVEMGANHLHEIKLLAEIADPNFGLITNVGHAHLEGFGSFENVIKAKGELYEYIGNRQDGKLFVDHENPYLVNMIKNISCIYYGTEKDLFVSGRVEALNPYLTFSWSFSQDCHLVKTQLIGEYNLTNVLAAVAVGKYFGVKTDKVCKALTEYTPKNSRSQLEKTKKNTLIIDAYNANPTSMEAAIKNFEKMDVSNKVLILGDMLELGNETGSEHQKIADLVVSDHFTEAFFIGNNFSKIKSEYPCFSSLNDFIIYLKEHDLSNRFILIKGSRGIQLEKCIDML